MHRKFFSQLLFVLYGLAQRGGGELRRFVVHRLAQQFRFGLLRGLRQPCVQLLPGVQDLLQRTGAPQRQRQHGGYGGHSGASPCVLHQPYPDGAHHRAPGGARRLLQHIIGQQGGVAVHAAVAVGKMLGGFQPLRFVQLPADQCL